MKIINLTPHAIRIRFDASSDAIPLDSDLVVEPTKPAARIEQRSEPSTPINGIPVMRAVFGGIVSLPAPREGTVYIVSLPVGQAAGTQGRTDVVCPDTSPNGGAVRNSGQVYAVRGFQQFL